MKPDIRENRVYDSMRTLRIIICGLLAAFAFALIPFGAFAAAGGDITPVGPDAQTVDTAFLNLPPYLVSFILGSAIPFLIAFFTGPRTQAWVKKLMTLVLSALGGLVTVGLTDGGNSVISQSSVIAAVNTVIAAMVAYFVTLRNSAVEVKLQEAGPNIGPEDDTADPAP